MGNYSIADVEQAIRGGAQQTAELDMLNRQRNRAEVLRDTALPTPDQYNYVNPLQVIASSMRQARGKRALREIEPKIQQAQGRVNEGQLIPEMYGLQRAKAAQDLKQQNYEADAAAKVEAANVAEANRLAEIALKDDMLARRDARLHENAKELLDMKTNAEAERAKLKGVKMSPNDQKLFSSSTRAMDALPELIALVKENEGGFGNFSALTEYIPDYKLLTPLNETIKNQQKKFYTEKEKFARSTVHERAYQIIHSLAGATLSAHEKSKIEDFVPAPNDSPEDVIVKLQAAYAAASRNVNSLNAMYGKEGAGAATPQTADAPSGGGISVDSEEYNSLTDEQREYLHNEMGVPRP